MRKESRTVVIRISRVPREFAFARSHKKYFRLIERIKSSKDDALVYSAPCAYFNELLKNPLYTVFSLYIAIYVYCAISFYNSTHECLVIISGSLLQRNFRFGIIFIGHIKKWHTLSKWSVKVKIFIFIFYSSISIFIIANL